MTPTSSFKFLLVSLSLLFTIVSFSQNLLNTSTWTTGTGTATGFSQNGSTIENIREYGLGPSQSLALLWKASPDNNSNADGGWNTSWVAVNHNKTYRFSVWIKKTNSKSGTTYLGFYANNGGSLMLNDNYHSNPYFWFGDLPILNRWYLIVGFVHNSKYKGTTHYGGIYDGITGVKVKSITDYKLKNTATAVKHRSYLYYDTNTSDRQYFFNPRIDVVNGNEPSIEALLNKNTTLKFKYDNAGNQIQYRYCLGDGCTKKESSVERDNDDEIISENLRRDNKTEATRPDVKSDWFKLYPNPTSGMLYLQLHGMEFISIDILDISAKHLLHLSTENQEFIDINLSEYPSGTYLLKAIKNDGKIVTRKIIKK